MQLLEDRTSFSTLTVQIFEPGAAAPVLTDAVAQPTLATYWRTARQALITVIGSIMVAGVALLPLLLPLAVGLVVWRGARRRPAAAVVD